MSAKKIDYIRAIDVLPILGTEKHLLSRLAGFYNPSEQGTICPTVKTLAQILSKSEGTTRRIISGLAKQGWLRVEDTIVAGHRVYKNSSNRYFLPKSILVYKEVYDLEAEIKTVSLLRPAQPERLEVLHSRLEDALARLDEEKKSVSELKPRQSQLNGRKGFEARFPLSNKKPQQEPREGLVIELNAWRMEKGLLPPTESTPPPESKHTLLPSLAQDLETSPMQRQSILESPPESIEHSADESPSLSEMNPSPQQETIPPPNMDVRQTRILRKNLNMNLKPTPKSSLSLTKISGSGEVFEISPTIKLCAQAYSEKLAKPKLSPSQLARFESEFLARGFTVEGFEKNLELVANDELLKRTTFSITRILEIDTAIKAKELFKTRMLKELQRSVGNMSRFDDFIFAEAKNWGFKTHEELFEWLGFKTESSAPKQASQQFTEIAKPISKDVEIKAQAVENEPFQGEPLIVTESKILVDEILDICQDFEPVELSPELRNLLHNPPQRDTAPPFLDESVEELVDELRELLVAPNFRPYLGSSEIIDYLVQKLSKARYFSDLFALILHPIFRQTASKSVARNIKAA